MNFFVIIQRWKIENRNTAIKYEYAMRNKGVSDKIQALVISNGLILWQLVLFIRVNLL